ncbi:MAG: ankyrin repeat domain-containing protein [Candidatus Amoebophilus sp.]
MERNYTTDQQINELGDTLLHQAAGKGDLEEARRLLEQGVDVNTRNKEEYTPLHTAALNGQAELSELLIENGADVQARNAYGNRPIDVVFSEKGNLKTLEVLESHGARIFDTESYDHYMYWGIHRGQEPPIDDADRLLARSVRAGNIEMANHLIDRGASLYTVTGLEHDSLMHDAVESGSLEMVKFLVEKGAPIDERNDHIGTPVHLAAWEGNIKIMDFLLSQYDSDMPLHQRGANNYTVLDIAARQGNLELAKFLVEQRAPVNRSSLGSKEEFPKMPLHIAAENGHSEVAQFLLDNGADLNIRTFDGYTPLHFAAKEGHDQVARTLLENGADVNARDKEGLTPLHVVVEGGHIEVASIFLNKGADINMRSNDNRTPLHLAAYEGKTEMIKFLLEKGADVNMKDHTARKPLDVAREREERHTSEAKAAYIAFKLQDTTMFPKDVVKKEQYEQTISMLEEKEKTLDIKQYLKPMQAAKPRRGFRM